MEDICRHIDEMKRTAELLMPYSFPMVGYTDDLSLLPLKQRVITVDGYELTVFYSKSDHQTHQTETLQIQSRHSPFLPFNLVCKVGQMFLGPNCLTFTEFFNNNRRLYCWTIRTKNGQIFPVTEAEPAVYEGFEYNLLHNN